jgi:hypothetical protein
VAVLLVEEHLLHQPLQLWAVQVVAEALTALRQEQVQQVEPVTLAHLLVVLEPTLDTVVVVALAFAMLQQQQRVALEAQEFQVAVAVAQIQVVLQPMQQVAQAVRV